MNKLAVIVTILAIAAGALFFGSGPPERPPTPPDTWWGFGSRGSEEDTSIREFKVSVPDSELTDLKARISNTRVGMDLEESTFEYGFQVKYMKEVIDHWQKKYDWRKQEAIINSFPQFLTNIDGIDIHFMHVKPTKPVKKVFPLLLLHGWPGSVWEFYKILPLLTESDHNNVAFEVICPSIPGYGFSEQPHKKGFDGVAAASVFRKLMLRLGHDRFYVQGGDWGSQIATMLATIYPENVKGVHVNLAAPQRTRRILMKELVLLVWPSLLLTEAERNWKGMGHAFTRILRESGYYHLQATRPDTPAFALNDSPVGLAAYILEKFSVWTHEDNEKKPDGGISEFFTLDEVLTNVMVYWVTGSIGSSMRFYKENIQSENTPLWDPIPVEVPAGIAAYPQELVIIPRTLAGNRFSKLIQYSNMPKGGHFAALQEPLGLSKDVRSFVDKVEAL